MVLNWTEIVEGEIFELLQRIVITDLKPPIFYKIKEDPVNMDNSMNGQPRCIHRGILGNKERQLQRRTSRGKDVYKE